LGLPSSPDNQLGQICTSVGLLVKQGKCEPGCRVTNPNNGAEGSLDAPYRACGRFFECLNDNLCHVCGSSGQPGCTTKQNGNNPIEPCPYTSTPSGPLDSGGLCP